MKLQSQLTWFLALLLAGAGLASMAKAQTNQNTPRPKEPVGFTTADGWQLRADFYPGMKEQDSIPVVLLHGYEGRRQDFQGLAEFLQSQGHAVLVPDLRAHGESTQQLGVDRPIDVKRILRGDIVDMARRDMEACWRFLMEKNNAEELNIDQLVVGGAEMGATVAMLWSAEDWSRRPLTTGKQGQYVKAVVLISPEFAFKGVTLRDVLKHPAIQTQISMMIAVGKEHSGATREAKRIHGIIERGRPTLDAAEIDKKDLFLVGIDTRLQGARILEEPQLGLHLQIGQFIKLRVANRAADFPWKERVNPFSD